MPELPSNPPTGYLTVAVSTAQNAIPLENALVTVYSIDENNQKNLVFTTRTNASGQTPALPLAAPPVANSLEPGSSRPYARYAVTVAREGYQPVSTSDLTVFADIVATLPVYLVPLEEDAILPSIPQQRDLPRHSLNP